MGSGILKRQSLAERQIGHVTLDGQVHVLTNERLFLFRSDGVDRRLRSIHISETLQGDTLAGTG